MASSANQTDSRDAILRLAREFRIGARKRGEAMDQAMHRYNGATHERIDLAAEFLRCTQHEDVIYERTIREALERYRESIQREEA
jgi:hypothetical protein